MRAGALFVAWLLSIAPTLVESSGPRAASFAPASELALALLVWIAIASAPPIVDDSESSARRSSTAASIACALPALALAAAADLRSHIAFAALASTALVGLVLLALAVEAARRAARPNSRVGRYAACWCALFVLAPLLSSTIEWGAQLDGAAAPIWLRAVASASPLQWAFSSADSPPDGFSIGALPWAAFASSVIAVLAARWSNAERSA